MAPLPESKCQEAPGNAVHTNNINMSSVSDAWSALLLGADSFRQIISGKVMELRRRNRPSACIAYGAQPSPDVDFVKVAAR